MTVLIGIENGTDLCHLNDMIKKPLSGISKFYGTTHLQGLSSVVIAKSIRREERIRLAILDFGLVLNHSSLTKPHTFTRLGTSIRLKSQVEYKRVVSRKITAFFAARTLEGRLRLFNHGFSPRPNNQRHEQHERG